MSKSIYKEALEIIIIHGTALTESSKANKLKIIKALETAQKQEKLLELYREYFKIKSLPTNEVDIITFDRLLEIKEQIKELENE